MKRIFATVVLALSAFMIQAQDVKSVKKALDKNDLASAKQQIDAVISKEPTPEAWYLKSKIYGMIATSAELHTTVPDARMQAFEAFKKALETGAKDKDLAMVQVKEGNNFYKPLFDLYTGFYDDGAKYFNAGANKASKPDFLLAMESFKNANMIGGYIASNKWALSELDTSLILNIAKSALNADKTDEAVLYLKMLADKKISGTADGSAGYELPYQWLTFYYKDKGDEANLLKYSNLGRELFPTDDYYDGVMLDYLRKKGDKPAMFAKYEEVVKKFPDSTNYHFNYANDAFNYVYNSDAGVKITNKEELFQIIKRELDAALKNDPDNVNTNWLYGQFHYNAGIDLLEQNLAVKGTKPEDVKKKADLKAQANVQFNKAIPFVEKAIAMQEVGMKKSDKSRYKSIVDLGQRIYNSMGQKDKEKIYMQKYDAADAKFIKE